MKKRLGLALLGGVLTLFLLLTVFSATDSIAVLGDGQVTLSTTLESASGTMITGSSSGGNYGTAYNTEYSITYGGIEVCGITFKVSWDIPGEFIDWNSLKVTGKLYLINPETKTLEKLNEFTSSSRTSSMPMGTYAPNTLVDAPSLAIGSFSIQFKVVMAFDAKASDTNQEMHTAAVGHVKVWMYNDGGKVIDGPADAPPTTEIQGDVEKDPDYTGGTGIYDTYDPVDDDRYYVASVLPVDAGGSMLILIIVLVVMYVCFKGSK